MKTSITVKMSRVLKMSRSRSFIEPTRRDLIGGAGTLSALAVLGVPSLAVGEGSDHRSATPETGVGLKYAEPRAFSFEGLKQKARELAARAYVPGRSAYADILQKIAYDEYQQIRFRPDHTIPLGNTPIQLFHLGRYFMEPVRIHTVEGGQSREVLYDISLFDMPAEHPARHLPANVGFAGFRVMAADLKTDWLACLGASYFRTSGPYNQYGLSARGLAIDTGLPTPEEFPRFSEFFLEAGVGQSLTMYALLDSPSVSGAYRLVTRRSADERGVYRIEQDITLELFARKDIERLGLAPFSSMYWYGEGNRKQAADWRPEVHDSDGLAMWTGAGERLWRPLNNPPRVVTNTFVDRNPKGFGLLQRDRDFVSYLDDGVFYERRASVWVEPAGGWGEGAVHLLEIPTDDEIHDNIAVYWNPAEKLKAGGTLAAGYRLTWCDDVPLPDHTGWTIASFSGIGGRPGQARPKGVRKFVVDFQGSVFRGLGRDDGVKLNVTVSRGEISNAYSHPVVGQRERWRAFFDLAVQGADPVDIRAYLSRNGTALTETWLGQYFPEDETK